MRSTNGTSELLFPTIEYQDYVFATGETFQRRAVQTGYDGCLMFVAGIT